MLQLAKFEAYSLEDLCNEITDTFELGNKYFKFLTDDIIENDMEVSGQSVEYNLIYLQSIIERLEHRLDGYDEDEVDQWEVDLHDILIDFMRDKDEQTLVYIQGW